MSSISGRLSSPRFQPPQSAQPYRSLFGGSSSQDVPDLEPYSQSGGGYQNALDVIMEDGPLTDNNLSDDDASYKDNDADDSEPESVGARSKPAKKMYYAPTSAQSDLDSPPLSPSYRPNRFRGPESTWRKLTAEDRQNALALEEVRARDLAAHLYNAYALRVRAREIAAAAAGGEAEERESAFVPPKRWTVWPMRADEVPRGNEQLRQAEEDPRTLRMQPDARPSGELEESIMAVMMRSAKERFEMRAWSSRGSAALQRKGSPVKGDTMDEGTGEDGESNSEAESGDGIPRRPVVQADDDKSRLQLRSLTRNTITQFDSLLIGLHHARKGGAAADDSSATEWQSDEESAPSRTSSPRKRRASRNAERSQSRGRKRTRKSSRPRSTTRSRHAHESSGPASSRPRGRSDSRRSPSRLRLGLRDWSEVLGVASMVGLPPAVVMRTAKRCAALFGEDMEFQTLKEGKLQQTEDADAGTWEYAESESVKSEDSPPPPPTPKSAPSRSRAASVKRGSTSRATSVAYESADEVDGAEDKDKDRKKPVICPIKTCSRHEKAFSRTWNLNLHLKRMHPSYRARSTDAKPSKSPAVVRSDDEDE